MSNIGIFSFGRKESQRCPNKMLKPFADTTLTDIALSKLKVLGKDAFFAGYDREFKEKCRKHKVRFIQRNRKSTVIDGPITEILSFLKDLDYEYYLIISPCLPFLGVDTIKYFLNNCVRNKLKPAFSVIKKNNFYMSIKRRPLNFPISLKTINTKAVEPVYEFAHALYFFKKDYFFKTGRYWDWKEVGLVELSNKLETLDIDTEEDFKIAESIWKSNENYFPSV